MKIKYTWLTTFYENKEDELGFTNRFQDPIFPRLALGKIIDELSKGYEYEVTITIKQKQWKN